MPLSTFEKNLFRITGIMFLVNMVFLAAGSYVNLYLISSHTWITILTGTFLFVTLLGILRFILAVIKKSPAEVATAPAAVSQEAQTSEADLPSSLGKKWKSFTSQLGIWFRFSNVVVIFLIAAFGAITSIPLYVLVSRTEILSYNEKLRQAYAREWLADRSFSFGATRVYQLERIERLEEEIASLQQNGVQSQYVKDKQAKLVQLIKEEDIAKSKFDEELSDLYDSYVLSIETRFFYAAIARYVLIQEGFKPLIAGVTLSFLIPAILLLWLKSGKKFQYFRISAEMFRQVIRDEYLIRLAHEEELLRNKYQHEAIRPLHHSYPWKDSPFNKQKTVENKKRTPVDVSELLA